MRVVLVTGASQGIGLATAELLANSGYRVYATCRNPEKAEALKDVSKKIPSLLLAPLDVTSQESVDAAVRSIYEKEGRIDVVINNAGFGIYGPSEMHTIEEAHAIFNTNLFGVKRVNDAVVPLMRKQLKGRIINLGSTSGAMPSKNMPLYSASKAALEILTAADEQRGKKWNISYSLIQAGTVANNFESNTRFASRFKGKENPFQNVIMEDRRKWKERMDGGQSSMEVAQVIKAAVEDPQPKLWYQTSRAVEDIVGRHFKDLSGNSRVPGS